MILTAVGVAFLAVSLIFGIGLAGMALVAGCALTLTLAARAL
jgi:hypothetical protein